MNIPPKDRVPLWIAVVVMCTCSAILAVFFSSYASSPWLSAALALSGIGFIVVGCIAVRQSLAEYQKSRNKPE